MGHYYTYIRNYKLTGMWWKFNDSLVRQATQEEVEADANGGLNGRTANFLAYISDSKFKELSA